MSILKTAGISLGIIAIIGGGSLAVISANAQGRMFDSTASQFLTSGDLLGYKNYLIGKETTRIDAIDQAQFTKIQSKYTAQKPFIDLAAKYEPQLITLATNKDQAGFVTLFKQYQAEAKPLMDARQTARQVQKATQSSIISDQQNERINKANRPALTDAQLTDMANRTYSRAVEDIAAGRTFKIGFGGIKGHRGGFGGKEFGHTGNKNIQSSSSASIISTSIN